MDKNKPETNAYGNEPKKKQDKKPGYDTPRYGDKGYDVPDYKRSPYGEKDEKKPVVGRDVFTNKPNVSCIPDSKEIYEESFIFVGRQGIVKVKPEEVRGKKHFLVRYTSGGRELERIYYDDAGNLSKVVIYDYDQDRKLVSERFFSTSLLFKRARNPKTGVLEERDSEGNLVNKLREN